MPISCQPKPGVSLVELVVTVALLSIVSLAAIQLLNMTEKTMIGSQTKLNQPEGENPVKFAHQIALDMERFREFCQSAGTSGG